jgi:lipopolysaccharide biosynthesis glycosyltransferase
LSPAVPSEPIHVVCAVEGERHVHHCAVMLHSLLEHNRHVRIDYLYGNDTARRGRRKLARMVRDLGGEIEFHRVAESWVEGLPIKDFTRKATWYRISLDELLPHADRILYLDVDLLVCQSLLPLWQTPMRDHLIGAVTNVPPDPDLAYTQRPQLGGDLYFNAGVLLMDLAAIRREGVGPVLREHAVRHAARMKWRDQDALNEVLHGRRLPLRPKWNCMNAVVQFSRAFEYFDPDELEEARRSPAIRHFEGPLFNKPWHILAREESWQQYRHHRRQTPWPRVLRTGLTPVNVLRYLRRRLV